MKMSICIALVFLIPAAGCRRDSVEFGKVTNNPGSWVYLAAREARLREPTPDAGIRDQRLDLTDAQILSYNTLDRATNQGVLLAMPSHFRTKLVTGSIPQAAIPENRGKVLPVVVDRKIEIHFLSQRNGQWFSTNVLRTRVVSLTCSP
jgi:hypothetical protein